jgi:pimeloyl-ACP methyl ester carboxylesterase
MTSGARFLSIFLCGVLGCLEPVRQGGAASPPEHDPNSAKRGVVFVVGGVGGYDCVGLACQHALPQAGVPHEVRDFVWTHGFGKMFKDLQDTRHLLKKADELAEAVRQVKADPDRPVYLIGKSGGTGLVLAAAEQLPPDCVERIVLLSAAVSPSYDLRGALRASKGGIVSFHSRHDKFILGWGTSQFGTTDRYYGPSAGLTGFVVPDGLNDEDLQLYDRLVQIPWNSSMIWEGHPGSHFGTSMPGFVGREVAPWLKP